MNHKDILFHICKKDDWESAQNQGFYKAESLDTEGFIHCSTPEQVIGTANLLFQGQQGLVILVIDQSRVNAEIKFENTTGGEMLFPHIYGVLNVDAVQKTLPFEPNLDGFFEISLP